MAREGNEEELWALRPRQGALSGRKQGLPVPRVLESCLRRNLAEKDGPDQ